MKTRNNLVFIFFLFLFLHTTTSALIINEVMYDPEGSDTDREWIEVLNNTNDTLDLTSWKFFEANTNHGLTAAQGTLTVPVGGYAVISNNPARFLQDNPTYQGILIKASFSLSNGGEYLAMKNGSGSIQDSLTYIPSLGGQDDGTTLSFLDGIWLRGEKTPGAANVASSQSFTQAVTPPNTASTNGTEISQPAPPLVTLASISAPSTDLNVSTVNEKVVMVGADAEFTARASIGGKKVPENAEFTWSFGDGGTRKGKSVGYHYHYPGVYVAIVEVSADGAIATAKTKVKVIAPELSISDVGAIVGKNYIEISNSSLYEVDLSNWFIDINGRPFQLPRNTTLMGKQKVRFAGASLGFDTTIITPTSTIKLLYPDRVEMLRYVASTTPLHKSSDNTEVISPSPINKVVYKKAPVESKVVSTTTPIKNQETKGVSSWFKKFLSKL